MPKPLPTPLRLPLHKLSRLLCVTAWSDDSPEDLPDSIYETIAEVQQNLMPEEHCGLAVISAMIADPHWRARVRDSETPNVHADIVDNDLIAVLEDDSGNEFFIPIREER